ncbi:MAG: hypothetical protein PF505_04080 [Vallitaleaceae bacterium]|jgi:Zn-dependent protease|nr:hypothetical protein [Vallitaleaceae bacterium]
MGILLILGINIVAAVIVMIIHEIPKSLTAYLVTHPIYRQNALPNTKLRQYVDPIGLCMFVFMGIGWQKSCIYKSSRFRDKEKGMLYVAIEGLLSNIVLIIILVPIYNITADAYVKLFVFKLIYFSFGVTIINLLPVTPFDMSKVIQYFSPEVYYGLIKYERTIHIVFIIFIASTYGIMLVNGLFNTVIPLKL